jgi:hypothetical protein
MPVRPALFAFDVPPLGTSGAVNASPSHPPYSGQTEQHDVLGRFHDLFHPAGVGHHPSSTQLSAFHSPHLDPASAESSSHPSPHPDARSTTTHDDSSGHLSTFFSSFFPPPEPSHFTGPLGLTSHEPSQPAATEPTGRRPSSNFSFSPTSFANLHLPPLPGRLGGLSNGGDSEHQSHVAHLPPLLGPLAPAAPDSSCAQASSSVEPTSSFLPTAERPAIFRQSTVDSPISPLLALAPSSSSAAPTPGPSTGNSESSPIGGSASSRGRKRALPAAKDLERTARGPSVAAATREDDASVRPPSIVIGGELDSPSEVANREAMEDDKRRRNTEACAYLYPAPLLRLKPLTRPLLPPNVAARFRAKKKNHTVNLTRTVSDLTSRVAELEVEANDLRREQTWLRSLVVARAQGRAAQASGDGGG